MEKVREIRGALVHPYSYPFNPKTVNRTDDDSDLSRLKKSVEELKKKLPTIKEEDNQTLFEQVAALFKEKLAVSKEQDLEGVNKIWIRDSGNEIFVWAEMKGYHPCTRDCISLISLEVSSELLPIDIDLLTFFDHQKGKGLIFSEPHYTQLYPL